MRLQAFSAGRGCKPACRVGTSRAGCRRRPRSRQAGRPWRSHCAAHPSLPAVSGRRSPRWRRDSARLIVGISRCGLSGLSVTRLAPWNAAPAPIGRGKAAAVRQREGAAHAVTGGRHFLCLSTAFWLSSHGTKPWRRSRRFPRQSALNPMSIWRVAGSWKSAPSEQSVLLHAVKRIDDQHRVTGFRQALAHLPECGPQAENVGQISTAGCLPLDGCTK